MRDRSIVNHWYELPVELRVAAVFWDRDFPGLIPTAFHIWHVKEEHSPADKYTTESGLFLWIGIEKPHDDGSVEHMVFNYDAPNKKWFKW